MKERQSKEGVDCWWLGFRHPSLPRSR